MAFLCPVCKTATMESASLEEDLPTERCTTCGGHWVTSVRYFAFAAGIHPNSSATDLPPVGADSPALKICPTCLKFMHYYLVGHGLPFGIDKCNTCGGVWLNAGEWEAIRAAGFARQLHAISSDTWQEQVARQSRAQAQSAAMERRLGPADHAELQRVGEWIARHPHRAEMLAYLCEHAAPRAGLQRANPSGNNARMELICVHVPKCAGTSLRMALIAAYGAAQVYLDDGDRLLDPKSPVNVDRAGYLRSFMERRGALLDGKLMAYGHLCIHKYQDIPAARVTILREPVERLVSHYFYWQSVPPNGHGLHDRFLAEKPGLVDFARMREFRRFYTDVMFGGVDMAIFDLIGSMDRFEAAVAGTEALIGRKLDCKRLNENAAGAYQQRKREIMADAPLRAKLRDILADDVTFFEKYAHRT